MKTPPQVPKSMPSQVAAVVGVAKLEPQSIPTFVEAFGTVVAAREARVQPEVTGRIVGGLPELVPGGLVTAGKTLFEIDKADYEIAVDQAMAELDVARLRIEGLRAGVEVLRKKARQAEAEVDYSKWNMERLGTLSENDQAGEAELKNAQTDYASQRAGLASLQAQIVEQERTVESAIAEAAVAESKLAAARLALSRTSVQAPFDAIVLTESVEVGQLVGPQTVAARLAAVDEFWIEAAVPVARVRDIQYSENGKANGSPVTVTLVTGSNTVNRRGVVLRPLGQLDPQGRMARIVVAVQDPLGLRDGGTGERDAILLGSYVRVSISARTLDGVYAIPRHALRENNRVWVRDRDGTLGIRAVDIVWRRQDDVLVRAEFAEHDELVTTHLASVVPGMPLDIRKENEAKSASAEKSPLSDDS
ncbi:MAG: HlyD family efflux transporter periplasmic adaptor subunit [Phycisphaerae bacterium]